MSVVSAVKALLATALVLLVSITAAAPDLDALNDRFFRVAITANEKPLLAEAMFEDPDGRFIVKGASLANVIARAYGLQAYQVVDAPDWVHRTHLYDIEAEPPPAELVVSDKARMPLTLLVDSFGVHIRQDKREVTMLVLDMDGERQRELAREVDCTQAPQRNAPARRIQAPGSDTRVQTPDSNTRVQTMRFAPCTTPRFLVSGLARQVGEPIHDLTGADTLLMGTAVRLLPDPGDDSLALATASLAESGLVLERRAIEIDVLVVTAVKHPQLGAIDH